MLPVIHAYNIHTQEEREWDLDVGLEATSVISIHGLRAQIHNLQPQEHRIPWPFLLTSSF